MGRLNIRRTILTTAILVAVFTVPSLQMSCTYGERGSLTVYCANATTIFFKQTPYRFDHLDETLKCVNCILTVLESGPFDISGNQIKTLDIRNSSITKISYKAFIGLIFMEKLLLSDNPIMAIYPGAFIGVRKVKYLELENAISHLEPDVFQELHLLEVLILRRNKISVLEEHTFNGLNNLKILDLSSNQLVNLNNNSFNPLTSLRALKLQNSQLTRVYGDEFNNLKALLLLNLENNQLRNFTINIDSNNQLRILNLAKNRLNSDGVKIGAFQNLNKLEELDLSQNMFVKIPPKFFQGLYRLRILNLYKNYLKEFYTGSFSGLPHLLTLNISSNNLETAKVTGRLLLHSLHTIDLSDNHIKKFDYIDFIARTPRITNVILLNNDLSCDTVSEIETLFMEDGIRFLMNTNEPENCKDTQKTAAQILKELTEDKYKGINVKTSPSVWIILMAIIILLVVILFYVQISILYRIQSRSFSFHILPNRSPRS